VFFFIGKTSLVYGSIAFGFSMLGVILPDAFLVGNPLEVSGVTHEHIIGHIMWGLVAGIASFSFRYAILSGLFPIILDFDHWIQFFWNRDDSKNGTFHNIWFYCSWSNDGSIW